MRRLHFEELSQYRDLLKSDKDEQGHFRRGISIYHTEFVRDPLKFRVLEEQVVPEILEKKKVERKLRIWSAGCAGGEETYSIAMVVREVLGDKAPLWDVKVHGTDINAELVRKARSGEYGRDEFIKKAEDKYHVEKYVVSEGDVFRVNESIRRMVEFGVHDLMRDEGLPGMDIIFCRNVLIYFQQKATRAALEKFYSALANGGYLFLGNSEGIEDFFYCKYKKLKSFGEFYYRKIEAGSAEHREMEVKKRNIQAGLGYEL